MNKMEKSCKKKEFQFGIVPKLLVGILTPLFIVLIVMSIFLGIRVSKATNQSMGTELDAESKYASSNVSEFFEKYFGITECLSATQIVKDTTTEPNEGSITTHRLYGSLLETISLIQADNSDGISCLWVADFQTGEVVQNDGKVHSKADIDITTRDWYKLVMEKQDTISTAMYQSVNNNETLVTIASPVIVNNEIVAIVGADLDMSNLNQILSTVTVGKNGYIVLYDSESNIVYHHNESMINSNIDDVNYSSNMLDIIKNKQDTNTTAYTLDNQKYYGSVNNIDKLGYTTLSVMTEEEFTQSTNSVMRILILGIFTCGVILAAICVYIALSITKPMKQLDEVVCMLAAGKLDVEVKCNSKDEVGDVAKNVVKIVDRLKEYILYINEVSDVLRQIGNGNLVFTLKQEYQGEFSKVKEALINIRSRLTDTMTSIMQSANQVNAGAEQIANGAQALAQGSTEQASSVQQLAATVQDLSTQATEESNNAVEAKNFLEHIKEEVEKCNVQMEQMRVAMQDISVQSETIRSIIKTIDDIAFQTNILALNAAVEAARAGTAGKGFAVVADEVRNLAGKSAEAARKTNEIIENSTKAVNNGEELTQRTAESLTTVATDTRKIVKTIDDVAEAYHNQAYKLSEISTGIDQIASVVQTNSATAEESAAASEELSAQATSMYEQISQFKLK